jgi:hypothetical protein
VGQFRSGGSDNACQDIPPGYKASLTAQTGAGSLNLDSVTVATGVTLDTLIKDPSGASYAGDLKSGIAPCNLGTEAYGAGSSRVPAPLDATYAAAIVADVSCHACDVTLFASKIGTAKCQVCRAGSFPSKSYAPGTQQEPGSLERGPDQCTPW